jgi:RecA/RadA recombinase
MEFLNDLIKESGNKYASIVANGVSGADIGGFVDTGCYIFNAILSGTLYGGIPDNKIIALAGESSTGKTYFTLGIVSKFLTDRPDGVVLYFDSEQAVTSNMIRGRGIDPKRVAVMPVSTIEEFRKQVISIVDKYNERKDKKPIMIVLDSMGMLSTTKEMTDTADGKETRDMTRAQVIKSTFRVLTLKLGAAGIPMIITNHTYASMGSMFPTKEMSGGAGLKYAASTIIFLSKKKVKDGIDVIGNIVHCKLYKSRLTKENSVVDVMLHYDSGLDPYYGLLTLAEKYGIIKKVSTKYEFPDGTKAFEKHVYKNPEKFFTKEIMDRLEEVAKEEFMYGEISTESEVDG